MVSKKQISLGFLLLVILSASVYVLNDSIIALLNPPTYTFGATEISDVVPPVFSLNSTNSSLAGTSIMHSLYWTDDVALSGYIFSFYNGSIFVNDSWVAMSGTANWSNVSKIVNSTVGALIKWCVYANDSSNNWNSTSCITPFQYTTTKPDINYTIWNGSNWMMYGVGNYPKFRCTETQTDCEPENQNVTLSQSIFRICNNGTANGTSVNINMNPVFSGITLKCDDDYTSVGAITLTTSNQSIHGSLNINSCVDISCWADYNNPDSGGAFQVNGFVI